MNSALLTGQRVEGTSSGDMHDDQRCETGQIVLREYVNGTTGFITLWAALGRSLKGLMRMLGPTGSSQARNHFALVFCLQRIEGIVL